MSKTNATTTNNRRPRILVLDSWSSDATRAVERQGAEAIKVSPLAVDAVERLLFSDVLIDGLLLTGGGDVDPRQYGAKPHKKVYGVNETRDYTELLALDYAREAGIPVLGICRGSQLMAVHNGGKLKQHIEGHRGISHLVFPEAGSLFKSVIGSEHGRFVSLHHQIVVRHGADWRVAARCKNGNVEAIESKDGRCLGVQFHPEMDTGSNECSRRIFRWLALESAKRAGLKEPTRRKPKRAPLPKPVKPLSPRPRTVAERARARTREQFPAGPPLPKPRTRQPELPLITPRGAAVRVSWFCPHCGLRFDKQSDRTDHITWLHGDPIIRVTEPPPGHPDWD